MRIKVSIPNDVLKWVDMYARQTNKSRNKILSDALQEHLPRLSSEHVTEAMNRVLATIDEPDDGFVSAAARRTLRRVEW